VKFVVFYLVCGIGAGLAHAVFNAGSFGPLVGASGAVAGLMGAYIMLFPHARVYVLFRIVIPIPLPLPAVWMLGVWLAVQLFNLAVAGDSPIAWWAHIGGMAIGAGLVVPLRRRDIELFGGR
jgi:membrane associated rhomboid family serine protease